MSYDVDLMVATGARSDGSANSVSVFSRNHTSNTARMWRAAGCDIAEFHGKGAIEFGAALEKAIGEISTHPKQYREMEPDNRWGTVESTLEFLNDLLEACDRHNLATVAVDR